MKHTESARARLCPTVVCLLLSLFHAFAVLFCLLLFSAPLLRCCLICLIVFLPSFIFFFVAAWFVFLCSSIVSLFFRIPGQSLYCLVMCTQCYHLSVGAVTCSHGRNTPPPPNTSEGVRDLSYSLIRKDRERK